MIDVKQLMIGNVVNCYSNIVTVKVIDNLRNTIYFGDINTTGADEIDVEFVAPIPLTEKVLEACGFIYDKEVQLIPSYYKTIFKNNIGNQRYTTKIRVYTGVKDVYLCSYNDRVKTSDIRIGSCKHLHTLQNLIFTLTQTELPIDFDKLNNAIIKP